MSRGNSATHIRTNDPSIEEKKKAIAMEAQVYTNEHIQRNRFDKTIRLANEAFELASNHIKNLSEYVKIPQINSNLNGSTKSALIQIKQHLAYFIVSQTAKYLKELDDSYYKMLFDSKQNLEALEMNNFNPILETNKEISKIALFSVMLTFIRLTLTSSFNVSKNFDEYIHNIKATIPSKETFISMAKAAGISKKDESVLLNIIHDTMNFQIPFHENLVRNTNSVLNYYKLKFKDTHDKFVITSEHDEFERTTLLGRKRGAIKFILEEFKSAFANSFETIKNETITEDVVSDDMLSEDDVEIESIEKTYEEYDSKMLEFKSKVEESILKNEDVKFELSPTETIIIERKKVTMENFVTKLLARCDGSTSDASRIAMAAMTAGVEMAELNRSSVPASAPDSSENIRPSPIRKKSAAAAKKEAAEVGSISAMASAIIGSTSYATKNKNLFAERFNTLLSVHKIDDGTERHVSEEADGERAIELGGEASPEEVALANKRMEELILQREAQLTIRDQDHEPFQFKIGTGINRSAYMAESAKTVKSHLHADARNIESITNMQSIPGYYGAKAVIYFLQKNPEKCPNEVVFAGRDIAYYQREFARYTTEIERNGVVPTESYNQPQFDKTIERDCKFALFNGILSGACSSFSSKTTDSRISSAFDIYKLLSLISPTLDDSPTMMIFNLLPLISPNRIFCDSDWREIGRAIKHAFPKTQNLTIQIWKEFTAQKILSHKLRNYLKESKLANEWDLNRATDRKLFTWAFSKEYKIGQDIIKSGHNPNYEEEKEGEEENEEVVKEKINRARKNKTKPIFSTTDRFDPVYCANSFRFSKTEDWIESIANDVFARRMFGSFLEKVPSDIYKDGGGNKNIELFNLMFVNFIKRYKEAMMHNHSQMVWKFFDCRRDINDMRDCGTGDSSSDDEEESSDAKADVIGPVSVPPPPFPIPKEEGAVVENKIQRKINKTVKSESKKLVEENERIIAERRIYRGAAPEDYEWSSIHELNSIHMFFAAINEKTMLKELKHSNLYIIGKIKKLCSEIPNYNDNFGEVLKQIIGLKTQHEIDLAISILLDYITKNDERVLAINEHAKDLLAEVPRVTFKTLGFYAKRDYPEQFGIWQERWAMSILSLAIDPSTQDQYMSDFFARLLWQKIIAVPKQSAGNSSSTTWYILNEGHHYLRPINGTAEIGRELEHINNTVLDFCCERITETHNRTTSKEKTLKSNKRMMDEDLFCLGDSNKLLNEMLVEIKNIRKKSVKVDIIMKNIRNSEFINCPSFSTFENISPAVVAFENGVVDMGGDKIVFREGKIEDFVTKSTKINMPIGGEIEEVEMTSKHRNNKAVDIYYDDHPHVREFMSYMGDVFPDAELLEYCLKDMSGFYYGRNLEKKFRIWSGDGNNSKSVLAKIFQKAFGEYCFDMPAEVLSSKQVKNSSAASPEMAQSAGSRIAFLAEPSAGLEMDSGLIKRITGGDRIFARKLHDNGGSIEATYKIILCCNDPPNLSGFDTASRNRIEIIPFLSTWDERGKTLSREEQIANRNFAVDINFESKIPMLAQAMVWKLFHYYPKYKKEGIAIKPKVALEAIAEYWRNNDISVAYMEEFVEQTTAHGAKVLLDEAFILFSEWMTANNGGEQPQNGKKIDRRGFKGMMNRKDKLGFIKKPAAGTTTNMEGNSYWTGHTLKPGLSEQAKEMLKNKGMIK